jgi:hypothetical protein
MKKKGCSDTMATISDPRGAAHGAAALSLPIIKANGFTVVSDAGAAGPDGALHLLSLLGRKPAVEAVSAACLTGRGAVVYPSPQQAGFDAHAPRGWEFRQIARRLPSGDAHLLLLPARADVTRLPEGAFTVIAPLDGMENAVAPARLHYLFLSQSTPTPLDPGWEEWLWTRAHARAEARPLRCWGALSTAWACHPDQEALRADLIDALRGATTYGCLPLPQGATTGERILNVA